MAKDEILEHEENIAKILSRVISICKENQLVDLAKKGDRALKNYNKLKNMR